MPPLDLTNAFYFTVIEDHTVYPSANISECNTELIIIIILIITCHQKVKRQTMFFCPFVFVPLAVYILLPTTA